MDDKPSEGGPGEDAWEIVQDGSQLNDFRGSQLERSELQSSISGAPTSLRQSKHLI